MAWLATIWLLSCVALHQTARPQGDEKCAAAQDKECALSGLEEKALLQLRLADDVARGGQRSDVEEDMAPLQNNDEGAAQCIFYHLQFPGQYKGDYLSHVLVRFVNVDPSTFSVPMLTLPNASKRPLDKQYNGYETPTLGNYLYGQAANTIYYNAGDRFQLEQSSSNWALSGVFPNAAYTSVELSYGGDRHSRLVFEGDSYGAFYDDGSAAPNPYVTGNPAVLTYKDQARCAANPQNLNLATAAVVQADVGGRSMVAREDGFPWKVAQKRCTETNTQVYRLPRDLSKTIADGGNTTGGCSSTYLFSPGIWAGRMFGMRYRSWVPISKSYGFTYGFIKMKLPRVFNNFEERVYQRSSYDTLMFDVSSNFFMRPPPNVPFTVTTPMMQADGFHTEDQFGYILFAPLAEVRGMQTDGKTPPVVKIPCLGISAYLINAPDFLFVFRYRGPKAQWQGSPDHAPCADELISGLSKPATCEDLGAYLPQITRVDGVSSVTGLVGKMSSMAV